MGAKVLSLRQAMVIASLFEFAGAFALGSLVSDTIKKGIIDVDRYEDKVCGMLCVP